MTIPGPILSRHRLVSHHPVSAPIPLSVSSAKPPARPVTPPHRHLIIRSPLRIEARPASEEQETHHVREERWTGRSHQVTKSDLAEYRPAKESCRLFIRALELHCFLQKKKKKGATMTHQQTFPKEDEHAHCILF